jgi:hypothetical protein
MLSEDNDSASVPREGHSLLLGVGLTLALFGAGLLMGHFELHPAIFGGLVTAVWLLWTVGVWRGAARRLEHLGREIQQLRARYDAAFGERKDAREFLEGRRPASTGWLTQTLPQLVGSLVEDAARAARRKFVDEPKTGQQVSLEEQITAMTAELRRSQAITVVSIVGAISVAASTVYVYNAVSARSEKRAQREAMAEADSARWREKERLEAENRVRMERQSREAEAERKATAEAATNEKRRLAEEQAHREQLRRFAPEGTVYNLRRLDMKSEDGVSSIKPGEELKVVGANPDGTLRVRYGSWTADVPRANVTNDRDLASSVRRR